MAFLMPNDDF